MNYANVIDFYSAALNVLEKRAALPGQRQALAVADAQHQIESLRDTMQLEPWPYVQTMLKDPK